MTKTVFTICNQNGVSQKLLFPEILELLESETLILNDLLEELSYLGFEIEPFGKNTFSINGIPSDLKSSSIKDYLLGIIGDAKIESKDLKLEFKKKMALSLAKTTAITAGKKLDQNEMMDLVCKLVSSSNPAFTEENKKIISIFENDEIEKVECYSSESFVTETDIEEHVAFDMELHSISLICDLNEIELFFVKLKRNLFTINMKN